jgi:hypothetical protein
MPIHNDLQLVRPIINLLVLNILLVLIFELSEQGRTSLIDSH